MTKLVKESLNEFLGGLGALNRGKMKSFKNQCDIWFKKFAPSVKYSINDKMIITVNGSLYLYKAQVNSLPGNMYIKGELNLKHATNFSDLPEKLRVDGNVYLQDTAVTRLPNNFNVGESLYLTGLDINKLPKKLYVKKNLIIKGTKINKLPSDLFVGKQLYQGDLKFNKIPIGVKGDLMQESLNEFEQGQDPYEVMGLGKWTAKNWIPRVESIINKLFGEDLDFLDADWFDFEMYYVDLGNDGEQLLLFIPDGSGDPKEEMYPGWALEGVDYPGSGVVGNLNDFNKLQIELKKLADNI
jgi:hypothetical protein